MRPIALVPALLLTAAACAHAQDDPREGFERLRREHQEQMRKLEEEHRRRVEETNRDFEKRVQEFKTREGKRPEGGPPPGRGPEARRPEGGPPPGHEGPNVERLVNAIKTLMQRVERLEQEVRRLHGGREGRGPEEGPRRPQGPERRRFDGPPGRDRSDGPPPGRGGDRFEGPPRGRGGDRGFDDRGEDLRRHMEELRRRWSDEGPRRREW